MDDLSGFPRNDLLPHSYDFNGQLGHLPTYAPFPASFPQQQGPPQQQIQQPQQHNGVAPLIPRSSTPTQSHDQSQPGGPPVPARRKSSDASRPVRKRITRACDQCNQLRTKCDGQQPCTHCTELGIECQYNREQKKRGKASRKELAERGGKDGPDDGSASENRLLNSSSSPSKKKSKKNGDMTASRHLIRQASSTYAPSNIHHISTSASSLPGLPSQSRPYFTDQLHAGIFQPDCSPSYEAFIPDDGAAGGENSADYTGSEPSISHYGDQFGNYHHRSGSESIHSHIASSHAGSSIFRGVPDFKGQMALNAFRTSWQQQPSFTSSGGQGNTNNFFQSNSTNPFPSVFGQSSLRYPVLAPITSYLNNIMPTTLACDLMDFYFSSASSTHLHPMSPFILGYLFRRQSFLHPTTPRKCHPLLLASMLWVAAQTSDAPLLTNVPSARAQMCQKLLQLILDLLKPVSQNVPWDMLQTTQSSMASMGFGTNEADDLAAGQDGFSQTVSIDHVAAYIHLATVMSASESKAASIRWWTMAWSLARELKLGREVTSDVSQPTPLTMEQREERRRVWWMLYMADRHLALCYNKPLHLLDSECASLRLPIDDDIWQNGGDESDPLGGGDIQMDQSENGGANGRRGIEQFQCRGHGIFGFFLPLMFILGHIVNLHHQRSNPTFGEDFHDASHWNAQTHKISQFLQIFEESLRVFHKTERAKRTNSIQSERPRQKTDTKAPIRPRTDIQTRIVLTYSTYIMRVLHILLAGKWDPIDLLEDSESWISSQAFLTATSHAVSASEALGEILKLDPGLECMPFFFGIYLLQGSFLLFLITDRLRGEADPEVIKACETIIRAHDACVVTLSTDYQRSFCDVMRNTLAVAQGNSDGDIGEEIVKRRELLMMHRWTGDGTGLAL